MDTQLKSVAEECLNGSYEGRMDFPTVLGTLAAVGFEGYLVDYRKGTTTYYLSDGDSVEFENVATPGTVAPAFSPDTVGANVRQSQSNGQTYTAFCKNVKNAGCAAYIVSIPGKRVVYFGRTGETHVEIMP